MKDEILLFAYGTLLDEPVQRRIIGRVVPVTPNRLKGYRIGSITLGGNTYPRIEPDAAGEISGGVLALTAAELPRVDAYEGPEYDRVAVTLDDGTVAQVYVKPGDGS